MTAWALVSSVLLGLLVNECCEVSPWVADKLVRRSAYLRYTNRTRAEEQAEDLAAYIKDRPGKLFKLLTALHFFGVALACASRRSKPVRDFWDKPPAETYGDEIMGWCCGASLLCLLVLLPGQAKGAAFPAWVLLNLLLGRGLRKLKGEKPDADQRLPLFHRAFLALTLGVLTPVVYLSLAAAFGLLITDAVAGDMSAWGWTGLASGFIMLQFPLFLAQQIRVSLWVKAGKPRASGAATPAR
jgi:hypothetical protein